MKYLFIVAALVLFATLLYWRLRPYLATARRVLGFVRDVRHMSPSGGSDTTRSSPATSEKLVRCQACETWIPATRAVTLGRSTGASYYCSHVCLERAADDSRHRIPRSKQR
ncbi:MAG: hypothetical protein H0W99_08585 [Acidobacteria bacterium]|nr:hypothetical protein [Acidobacteriota bacterium]